VLDVKPSEDSGAGRKQMHLRFMPFDFSSIEADTIRPAEL
jgi:hypothetical protein